MSSRCLPNDLLTDFVCDKFAALRTGKFSRLQQESFDQRSWITSKWLYSIRGHRKCLGCYSSCYGFCVIPTNFSTGHLEPSCLSEIQFFSFRQAVSHATENSSLNTNLSKLCFEMGLIQIILGVQIKRLLYDNAATPCPMIVKNIFFCWAAGQIYIILCGRKTWVL